MLPYLPIFFLLCLLSVYGHDTLIPENLDIHENPLIGLGVSESSLNTASATTIEPTIAPTHEPTLEFTVEPTEEPVPPPLPRTAFGAAQVLQGISLGNFLVRFDLNSMVIKETVSMCMTGIYPSNITDFEVIPYDGGAIMARYLVLSNRTDTTYESLSGELIQCVYSGQFNTIMHANANAAGALPLNAASCNFIDTKNVRAIDVPTILPTWLEFTEEPTFEPTDEPSDEPTALPSYYPSHSPSVAPSLTPTITPTTQSPSKAPTQQPTTYPPTHAPSSGTPSISPTTFAPTRPPSASPTIAPSVHTTAPTSTMAPTQTPTIAPSAIPTVIPTTVSPSRAPTRRPSAAPITSPAPTSAPVVQIAATQTISGISFDTYSANPSLYDSVLKQTIADCLDGISPDDITDLKVTSVSRRLLLNDDAYIVLSLRTESGAEHRHLQTNAIRTSYVVRSSDPTVTFDALSTQLESAVSTGVFDTILNENAQDAGATELVGCQSSDVSTVPIHTSSGSSSDGLSAGAIAGIVIGCVVGVGLIIAAVMLIWRNKKVSPPEGQTNLELRKVVPG